VSRFVPCQTGLLGFSELLLGLGLWFRLARARFRFMVWRRFNVLFRQVSLASPGSSWV